MNDADLTETIEDSELLAILAEASPDPASADRMPPAQAGWTAAVDDMLAGDRGPVALETVRSAGVLKARPDTVVPGAALAGLGLEAVVVTAARSSAPAASPARTAPAPRGAGLGAGRVRMQGLRQLGSGVGFAEELHVLLARTPLFSGLGRTESRLLGAVMQVYEAETGLTLVTEGDSGDYMLLVMSGLVEVTRRDEHGMPVQIAVASPGQTLGEMSMVDGEPRFASCVTIEPCRVALLGRTALLALLRREPALGNKILLKLVSLLSERLRDSSAQLVNCLSAARPL